MQVTPEGGCLPAGETAAITVKFSPQEVEDCSRRLVATIPNLSASLQAPNRAVTASVLRPWCHFDLPPSDYITAGQSSCCCPGLSASPLHDLQPTEWVRSVFQEGALQTCPAQVAVKGPLTLLLKF